MKSLLLGFMVLLLLAGCSLDVPAQAGEATTSSISISGFQFNPGTARNNVGKTLTFTNHDSSAHQIVRQVIPSGASVTNSSSLAQNSTYTFIPSVNGTYEYECGIHPSMKGTLVIAP